jgi:hypothetical protein
VRGSGSCCEFRRTRPSRSSPAARWRTSPHSPQRGGTFFTRRAGTSTWTVSPASPVRVVCGGKVHVTVTRALRLLGLGAPEIVAADEQGRMMAGALRDALRDTRVPTIVCAQAGDVNTGAVDPLPEIANATREAGAWLHVDGAFGLWAAASPELAHLVDGTQRSVRLRDRVLRTSRRTPCRDQRAGRVSDPQRRGDCPRRSRPDAGVLAPRPRLHGVRGATVARTARRRGTRRADLCTRTALRRRAGATPGVRAPERSRPESGALPVRVRRADGRRAIRISVSNWQTSDDDVDRTLAAFEAAVQARRAPTR